MIARYSGGASGALRAARSGACVVVVDAFRASATIAVLASKGARVIPLESVEEAARYPADIRIGERGGAQVAGFDFGNSPTAILDASVPSGATVAMSTTNGTRVVEAARGAPLILAGCFVNATATARKLSDHKVEKVVVVGCGWRGRRTSEDEAASAVILDRLADLGAGLDERAKGVVSDHLRRPARALRNNSAAARLKRLGYERDLDFCLLEDAIPVAPSLVDGAFVAHTV